MLPCPALPCPICGEVCKIWRKRIKTEIGCSKKEEPEIGCSNKEQPEIGCSKMGALSIEVCIRVRMV